jgi:hypothetical protein
VESSAWFIVGSILIIVVFVVGFLLGRRSHRASGVSVPPSPEVIKRIEERIRRYDKFKNNVEVLHETTDDVIADINNLLNSGSASGP